MLRTGCIVERCHFRTQRYLWIPWERYKSCRWSLQVPLQQACPLSRSQLSGPWCSLQQRDSVIESYRLKHSRGYLSDDHTEVGTIQLMNRGQHSNHRRAEPVVTKLLDNLVTDEWKAGVHGDCVFVTSLSNAPANLEVLEFHQTPLMMNLRQQNV